MSLPCYLHVHGSSTTFEKVSKGSSEGLNRINCQLSKDLKINLQPSRKVNFYHQLSKVKININLQNVSRCFKSHYFSSSSWDSSSWRISKLEKPVLIFQKHFLSTLQYPTTCLYLKIFVRGQKQLTLIHTEVNIYFYFWTWISTKIITIKINSLLLKIG